MLKCELCEVILPDPGGDPSDVECQSCHKGHLTRIKDAQLVCEKAHQLNEAYFSIGSMNKKACQRCGSKTIYKCPSCDWEIPGNSLEETDPITLEFPDIPDYCEECGKPYPWEIYRRGIEESRGMDVPPKIKATEQDYAGFKRSKFEEPDLIKNKMGLASAQAREDSRRNNAEDIRKMVYEKINPTRNVLPPGTKQKIIKKVLLSIGIPLTIGTGLAISFHFKLINFQNNIVTGPQQNNTGPVNQSIQAEKVQIINQNYSDVSPKRKKEITKKLKALKNEGADLMKIFEDNTLPSEVVLRKNQDWISSVNGYLRSEESLGVDSALKFVNVKHDFSIVGIGGVKKELVPDYDLLEQRIVILGDLEKDIK